MKAWLAALVAGAVAFTTDDAAADGTVPASEKAGQESREAAWSGPTAEERAAQSSLERGLAYLALRQSETVDGSFPLGDASSDRRAAVGVTSLATLAFLAGGSIPGRGPYGREVSRALDYLLAQSNQGSGSRYNGYIARGSGDASKTHGHGFATLALAQAYGMAPRSDRLRKALVAAVQLIERSQGAEGGWEYSPTVSAAHEGSVTICYVQALRAARNSGLQVSDQVIARAEDYVLRLQKEDGTFRYTLDDDRRTTIALTAAGITTLNMAGRYDNGPVQSATDAIWRRLRLREEKSRRAINYPFYERLYVAQAFWQLSDPSHFERWFAEERERLIRTQNADGSWSGSEFGSCYATAVNCLVMALPEGILPIFQR